MNKIIPFFDLKVQYRLIEPAINKIIRNVCRECAFSDGKYVTKFEDKFARYCNAKYAIGVDNGTSALHLSMRVLNIGKDDEVVVPANTFISTAWAVSYVGAKPVFVDCDKDTWEIDPNKIESKISKKTKAIIGVHLYGQPFDIDAVLKIAKKHGLPVIEDCAQAHGALYKGKTVGGLAEIGCFSFYPSKNLGAYGEAGAVVTNNKKYAERVRKLKNHGARQKYYHDELGFNMRMDGLQAAILAFKLKYLNSWNKKRKRIAGLYNKSIKNIKIKTQTQPSWVDPVHYLFVVTIKERDKFKKFLERHRIGTGLHYPVPCHLQKPYRHLAYRRGSCPNAEYLASHCLSLPMFPELRDKEVKRVIDIVNSYS